jgi:hypothetical protein
MTEARNIWKRIALPDFITARGPHFCSDRTEGIRSLTMYEFDQAKISEAIQFASKSMVTDRGVEGFTCSASPWIDVRKAMKALS